MPLEKLQQSEFQDIMQEHIFNTIEFLFDNESRVWSGL